MELEIKNIDVITEENKEYNGVFFNGVLTNNITLYKEYVFTGCIFKCTFMQYKDFIDCTFIDCKFFNCYLEYCNFNECAFTNCAFYTCLLKKCCFSENEFNLVDFSDSALLLCTFEKSSMHIVDFSLTVMSDCAVLDCTLDTVAKPHITSLQVQGF